MDSHSQTRGNIVAAEQCPELLAPICCYGCCRNPILQGDERCSKDGEDFTEEMIAKSVGSTGCWEMCTELHVAQPASDTHYSRFFALACGLGP